MANGDEADYFFIPIKLRMGWVDNENALAAVRYIRQNFPWWDKHGGGGRHIVIHTGVGVEGGRHRCGGRRRQHINIYASVGEEGATRCQSHRCAGQPPLERAHFSHTGVECNRHR